MKPFLREPLVHFLALGMGLFVLFGLVGGSGDAPSNRVEISTARVTQLAQLFERTWQRPPTEQELDGLIEDDIREEIYYREAVAMGLDRGDTVVRRRLRQKFEFVAEDLATPIAPTEEQLETFLRENTSRFREPDRLSFRQVYLNPDRRGAGITSDVGTLLARLNALPADADLATLGDGLMLPNDYERVTRDDVARDFGGPFAAALMDLPEGSWSGPVESGFGLHLVRIVQRWPGAQPSLDAVRQDVEREWTQAHRKEAEEVFYRKLLERYVIHVERPGPDGTSGDTTDATEASK